MMASAEVIFLIVAIANQDCKQSFRESRLSSYIIAVNSLSLYIWNANSQS